MVLTNGNAASVAQASADISTLQVTFPNIQFSLVSAPNYPGGIGNNQAIIALNPTSAERGFAGPAIGAGISTVIPFSSAVPAAPPALPLTQSYERP